MKEKRKLKRRRDKLGNRMALIGITLVILSMVVVVNLRGTSLKDRDLEYQIKEENLQLRLDQEESRAVQLEEDRIYVQTKQYIEKMAKEKLGLVNQDEILLKPVQ
ncbi:MAG: septum formation initiator [Hungatella sp.]